jgi:hypothetical protein
MMAACGTCSRILADLARQPRTALSMHNWVEFKKHDIQMLVGCLHGLSGIEWHRPEQLEGHPDILPQLTRQNHHLINIVYDSETRFPVFKVSRGSWLLASRLARLHQEHLVSITSRCSNRRSIHHAFPPLLHDLDHCRLCWNCSSLRLPRRARRR